MAIIIEKRKQLSMAQIKQLSDLIYNAINLEPNLSYRSLLEITSFIKNQELYTLCDNHELVSFLFATPLTTEMMELHSLFTYLKFRRQNYMRTLLEQVLRDEKGSFLAVTFHSYTKILLSQLGFREISFSDISYKARFSFLKKRLSVKRLLSIFNYMKKSKPIFLLKS